MLAMAEELGRDDMLGMAAEELGGHDSLFWDEDSWAFPILAAEENDSGGKMSADIGNSDRCQKGKEVEAAAPAKGKKRKAGGCGNQKNEGKGSGGGGGKGSEGKSGGGDDGGGRGGEGGDGEHEQHIWIERERRKKMREMFTNLHSLIPHLPSRADKATIVDEAVQYIQKLEQTLESLEKQKAQMLKGKTSITTTCKIPSMNITQNYKEHSIQSREAFLAEHGSTSKSVVDLASPNPLFSGRPMINFKTWTSPNVILNACGNDAHINICCPRKPGLLTGICFVLEKYKIEVVSAQVSSDRDRCMCMIHAQKIIQQATGPVLQFPGSLFLVEDIFKQAASEIMLWVQSKYCV